MFYKNYLRRIYSHNHHMTIQPLQLVEEVYLRNEKADMKTTITNSQLCVIYYSIKWPYGKWCLGAA